ncbi:hypothetical protein BsWGS_21566 [Bradybaena similaris]
MVQMTAALAMTVLIAAGLLELVPAFPMKYFKPRAYVPPARLSIHAPVSGADLAMSRGIPIQTFVNSGVQSVGDYVYFDDVIAAGDPGYPYKQRSNSQVVILNKPELDNMNVGANSGPGYY